MQISPIFSKADDNAKCYRVMRDFQDDYEVGPAVLVRIDSKILKRGLGYMYKYAPITSEGYIIYAESFWDHFEEVEEIRC